MAVGFAATRDKPIKIHVVVWMSVKVMFNEGVEVS